ncbi:hypothetical protein ACIOJD_19950 [Streptomyces sp. NPDC088116]|uniref:hypothetical protein n=1 Tax=Streptomyces sp. NPDC088116 TaxID=3365825 RepID=UPI0038139B07
MMRVSLVAVPRRGRLHAAKMAVTAGAAATVAVPVTVVGCLVTQLALGPHRSPIDASGGARALIGAVVHLTLMSLFAAGRCWGSAVSATTEPAVDSPSATTSSV